MRVQAVGKGAVGGKMGSWGSLQCSPRGFGFHSVAGGEDRGL